MTGPRGALVPVLDADIKLTPAGVGASLLAVPAAELLLTEALGMITETSY